MSKDQSIEFEDSIVKKLLQIEVAYSERTAIQFMEECYTYKSLFEKAKKIAIRLRLSKQSSCLILTHRNISAYVGLLAALFAGKAYVFLNNKDSVEQLKKTVSLTGSNLIITDLKNQPTLNKINQYFDYVCLNDKGEVDNISTSLEKEFYKVSEFLPPKQVYRYAYLMFTSGSTGDPKGVPISHENLCSFLSNIIERTKPTEYDKFSHVNELTFDFSVYEIFSCWLSAACLCVLPENYIFGIDNYIKKNGITFWSSVPSLVNLLNKLNRLNSENFKSIRYSVFCGEALTYETAKLWQITAPNSVIDNLYGPTEATVAVTGYIWDGSDDLNILPIGMPFKNQKIYLIDNNDLEVPYGEVGELCLSGTQVFGHYWRNELETSKRVIKFNNEHLYRTGDLACADKIKGYIFKGRIDDQLKIYGYRVEKVDIENRIKKLLNTQCVALIAVKDESSGTIKALNCFFSNSDLEIDQVINICRQQLPAYMVPTNFNKILQLPYNKNGKIDYQMLSRLTATY